MAKKFTQDPETNDLEKYFTNTEYLRGLFADFILAKELSKRILSIHGVGGVGKSSLLKMFRLHCKSIGVPVALTSAEEAKSPVDVLSNWSSDLKADGVTLGNFQKTLVHYKAIQAKVEDQAKKAQEARKKAAEKVGTAVAKAVIGAAISLIPGGAIVNALSGIGVDALVDWLSGFLTKPDIDLLIDPTKALSKDFLEDITKVAHKRRLVLMLDTFEQMSVLNDWVCGIAKQLDENILLVITGREMINWDRQWDGWLAHTQVEELHPMTEDNMRELARRYYATIMGGEPDPDQVEAIIVFARGLPMVLATSVRLWVKYGQNFDIEEHKAEVYGDVVKRLREGVPPELLPILESAAIVRWFDRPILRAVTKLKDINAAYEELRRFPFVKCGKEGLRLHDSVRNIMEEGLRIDDSARHKDLHRLAAKYFEKQLKKTTSEEAENLELEWLYHNIRLNENQGIKFFQEMAEKLARYRLINRLRAVLNDLNTYPLEREGGRLWREYYNAKLSALEGRAIEAVKVYKKIGENEEVEPKLRAYALCDLGFPLRINRQLDLSIEVFEKGLSLIPLDAKLVASLMELAVSYRRKGELEKSTTTFEKARDYYIQLGDKHGLITALNRLKTHYLYHGLLKEAFLMRKKEMDEFSSLVSQPLFLKMELLGRWAIFWAWYGQFRETEKNLRDTIDIAGRLSKTDIDGEYRDLGYVLGMQGNYEEAEKYFKQSIYISERKFGYFSKFDVSIGNSFRGAILLRQGKINEAEQELTASLTTKTEQEDLVGIPEVAILLGILNEVKAIKENAGMEFLVKADSYYHQCLNFRWAARYFFSCGALTGLVRVRHAQGDYKAIPPLLKEAEQLAQKYEYNDYLASLRLTQGHIAWEQKTSKVLSRYKQTLIYALRYNRFLLDEVLSGRSQGTPLRPIIPFCLERGDEGRKMLIALQKWWKTGTNDIGTPRPDTISPILENIPLVEAEKIVREREPGDGTVQKSVLEQIEAALKRVD